MSFELRAAEFAIAIIELSQSLEELRVQVENSRQEPILFGKLQVYLARALNRVESFRPQVTDDIDYVSHLNLISEARGLLRRADLMTPAIPVEAPVKMGPALAPDWRLLQVPKLHLEAFAGDITKYPHFVATFRAMYATLPITELQKFIYLQSHLTGPALTKIQHLQPNETSYKAAWEVLDKNYDRKNKLVLTLYSQLSSLPAAEKEPKSLRNTFEKIEEILTALAANQQNIDDNPHLRIQILSKFPRSLLKRLCTEENPSLNSIREAVENYVSISEHVDTCTKQSEQILGHNIASGGSAATLGTLVAVPRKTIPRYQKTGEKTALTEKKTDPNCVFCRGNHFSDQCTKFSTTAERKAQLGSACYNCLKKGHAQRYCRYTKPCWHCHQTKRHHSSLCPIKYGYTTPAPVERITSVKPNNEKCDTKETKSTLFTKRACGTYLTAVIRVAALDGSKTEKLRIVMDTGSNQTYVTERAVRLLGLHIRDKRKIDVEVFGGSMLRGVTTASTEFYVYLQKENKMLIEAETTPLIAENITTYDKKEFLKYYPQYTELYFAEDEPDKGIDILIGNDYLWELLCPTQVIRVHTNAQLIQTQIGYFIVGRPQKETSIVIPNMLTLQQATEALWRLDKIGVADTDIDRDGDQEKALRRFYASIKFSEQKKRYEVGFPFKCEPPVIESNFMLALGRLRSLYKKYANNPVVIQTYEKTFRQQLNDGIIEQTLHLKTDKYVHYLPHHPVIAPDKTTKIRVVYDASAKIRKDSASLNETMYAGQNLMEDMVAMLLRFRVHKVALVADVERAFHQILLTEAHRDYTRFLWVNEKAEEPNPENVRVYRFAVVPFGIVSSPFLLAATMRHHLNENAGQLADQLKKDIYVDNVVTGANDEKTAWEFYNKSVELFTSCSMNLRMWNTNSEELKRKLPIDKRDEAETVSVLGLRWCTQDDMIHMSMGTPVQNEGSWTPKAVLKSAARFFDPLGLWLPITLRPKLFLQELRKRSYGWNTKLTVEECEKWVQIKNDLQKATMYKIPRKLENTNCKNNVQLHLFTDASCSAYAAAIYLRVETQEETTVDLIFSKGRVAPLNRQLTIPKLELMAAFVGAQALQFVRKSMNLERVCAHFWADSKCVLSWIRSTKILPLFIENRIKVIKKLNDVKYHYVESSQNIADLPSRTASYGDILNGRWFSGPEFLKGQEKFWPPVFGEDDMTLTEGAEVEMGRVTLTVQTKDEWQLIAKYSTLSKLLRITSCCMKFLAQFQTVRRKKLWQQPADFARTSILRTWVKIEQRRCYAEVLDDLRHKRQTELIRSWGIVIDAAGLLRVRGRMGSAPTPYEDKYLVLMPGPSKSNLTRLLILNEHNRVHHAGTAATLAQVRKLFWVPAGRRAVYHVIRKCTRCARYTKRPYRQPALAEYPEFRLKRGNSFEYVGLDQLGPLIVKNKKCYMLLYTCLVTRAITLELLQDMTNEQMSMAFRRIVAKRGSPKYIMSDKAVQFTTAKAFRHILDDPIEWKFIPPHASWAGGAYERLIGLTKQALFRTVHNASLTESQLQTIMCEIEASMNSRPMTYVYGGINEKSPLTPNDLIGVRVPTYADPGEPLRFETNVRQKLIENWRKASHILDGFWKRWYCDYLKYLRERNERYRFRKQTTAENPKKGEVVLVREPLTKRNKWPMGIIEELHVSHDGQVRSATVKMYKKNGFTYVHRPVQDLYPMELNDEEENDGNEEAASGVTGCDRVMSGTGLADSEVPGEQRPQSTNGQQHKSREWIEVYVPATSNHETNGKTPVEETTRSGQSESVAEGIAVGDGSTIVEHGDPEDDGDGNQQQSDEFSLDEIEVEEVVIIEIEHEMFDW